MEQFDDNTAAAGFNIPTATAGTNSTKYKPPKLVQIVDSTETQREKITCNLQHYRREGPEGVYLYTPLAMSGKAEKGMHNYG